MQMSFCGCFFFALHGIDGFRSSFMKKNLIIPQLSLAEKILWAASSIGVTVLFFLVPDKNPLTLIATLVGVTSLLFTAKGHVSGQFLQLLFCVLYAIVSIGFKYYGEAITYMCMTFPSDLFAAIVWLKHPSDKGKTEVKIAHLTPKIATITILLSAVVTVIFYFVLKVLGTTNLGISTLSIATSMMACSLTIFRVPYYALAYAANDIVLITMWTLASVANPAYIAMVFNFVIFLVNDIYGFISWKKIRATQEK